MKTEDSGPGRVARFFWRLFGVRKFGVPNLKEGAIPPPKPKPPRGGTGQIKFKDHNFIESPKPWPR